MNTIGNVDAYRRELRDCSLSELYARLQSIHRRISSTVVRLPFSRLSMVGMISGGIDVAYASWLKTQIDLVETEIRRRGHSPPSLREGDVLVGSLIGLFAEGVGSSLMGGTSSEMNHNSTPMYARQVARRSPSSGDSSSVSARLGASVATVALQGLGHLLADTWMGEQVRLSLLGMDIPDHKSYSTAQAGASTISGSGPSLADMSGEYHHHETEPTMDSRSSGQRGISNNIEAAGLLGLAGLLGDFLNNPSSGYSARDGRRW